LSLVQDKLRSVKERSVNPRGVYIPDSKAFLTLRKAVPYFTYEPLSSGHPHPRALLNPPFAERGALPDDEDADFGRTTSVGLLCRPRGRRGAAHDRHPKG
jgi:hypothetical protein